MVCNIVRVCYSFQSNKHLLFFGYKELLQTKQIAFVKSTVLCLTGNMGNLLKILKKQP